MAGGGGGDNGGGVSVRVASSWWPRMSVGVRGRVEWFEGRVDVIGSGKTVAKGADKRMRR